MRSAQPPTSGSVSPAAQQRLRLTRTLGLCCLAFLSMLSYEIARSATESLFLDAHSHAQLPLVWLLVAGAMVGAVALYDRYVLSQDLLRLYGAVAAASALILLLLLGARRWELPGVHYLIYTWKDIYVVLLVEIFYSYANTLFPIQTARWVYGLFGLLASLGSVSGALAVGWLASRLGTSNALLSVAPLLMLLWLICLPLARLAGSGPPKSARARRPGLRAATQLVRSSEYLALLLGLVALVQIVVTLIDFQYYAVLENTHPELDRRTGVGGMVYGAVAVATIGLHALTGPLLRLLGVPGVLGAVPTLLAGAVAAFAAVRGFMTAVLIKVASKVLDYTVFRAAKEILYIPLDFSEKTMGKSVIDMVVYRVAKAVASLLLLGLSAAGGFSLVTPLTLALIVGWFAVTLVIIRRFRRRVSRAEEMRPLRASRS